MGIKILSRRALSHFCYFPMGTLAIELVRSRSHAINPGALAFRLYTAAPMTPASFIAWRERLHLNRVEASAALGISRETLRFYETGKRRIPRYIALACAAVALGIKPHD